MAQSTGITTILLITLLFVNGLKAFSIAQKFPHHITWIENLAVVELEKAEGSPNLELRFTLHGENERIKLHLFRNDEILSQLEYVHYLRSDGSLSGVKPIKRSQHSIFKGETLLEDWGNSLWTRVGNARISVFERGDSTLFEGTFTVGSELFHIQTDSTFRRTQPTHHGLPTGLKKPYMIAWKDGDNDDLGTSKNQRREDFDDDLICGFDNLESNYTRSFSSRNVRPRHSRLARYSPNELLERQNNGGSLVDTIGSTEGCPKERLIALLGIATDCSYTADFGSVDEIEAHIISEINSASQVYEDSFNISLAIHNLSISDADCPSSSRSSSTPWNVPCTNGADTQTRLSLFSEWRGQFQDNNALWTLLTGCSTGSTVGISWLGEVCHQGSSFSGSQTTSSTNIVVRNSREWQVIAHETGHSFGAVHDCTSETCAQRLNDSSQCCPLSQSTCDAGGQFIMNPASGPGIRSFSPCSIGEICAALGRGTVQSNCLRDNEDVSVIDTPSCATGPSGTAGCDFTEATFQPTEDPGINTFGRTRDSSSWLDRNRNTVIIVASVVGSVIILLIAGCVIFLVRRKRRATATKIEHDNALERSSNMNQLYRYM